MKVVLADSWEKYRELGSGWERLLADIPHPSPFLHPDLCRIWTEHSPGRTRLAVIGLFDGSDSLCVVAPLCLHVTKKLGREIRRLKFMIPVRWLDSDFVPPGPEEGMMRIISQTALEEFDPDVVELSGVPYPSPTLDSMERLSRTGPFHLEILKSTQWRNSGVHLTGDWEEYLVRLSSKTRYNFRRAERGVKSEGNAVIERYGENDDIDDVARELEGIMEGSWKDPDPYRSGGFWKQMIKLMQRRGWLDLRLLRIDDHPAAFVVLLRYPGTIYFMQTGYHRDFAEASPGTYILSKVMQSCFEEKGSATRIEFLSSYPYLRKLADFTTERVEIKAYPTTLEGRLLSSAFHLWRHLRRRTDITSYANTDEMRRAR